MNSSPEALSNGHPMLIANAQVYGAGLADLRIEQGCIAAVGQLDRRPGERVLDRHGAAVLPGLNDHHIHLMAFAAALDSVACGPPRVHTAEELIEALNRARPNAQGWIRGIGYHESVAGDIDRQWLDRLSPDRPMRVQHRTGRLWIVNSAGLDRLAQASPEGVLPIGERGRFYDRDEALGELWGRAAPPVEAASRRLAAYGVTGLTDLTPGNDTAAAARFENFRCSGRLLQRVRVGGTLETGHALVRIAHQFSSRAHRRPQQEVGERCGLTGPTKVHLHDSFLPDFDSLRDLIGASHSQRREVAMHCVTEAELVFALAAFRDAGTRPGDRIEHASVTPPALLAQIRELGLLVVTQPHFVTERGDAYLRDLPAAEHAWLYRCRGFLEGGIPLAGGSDAPFGHADPWRAMRAAVDRRTASGQSLGAPEALSAEQALSLYLGSLEEPGRQRRIEVGAPADLCLLDRPWRKARTQLHSACVSVAVQAGRIIYRRGDRTGMGRPHDCQTANGVSDGLPLCGPNSN